MEYNKEIKDINNAKEDLKETTYNLELPDYMRGTVVLEKEVFINMRDE